MNRPSRFFAVLACLPVAIIIEIQVTVSLFHRTENLVLTIIQWLAINAATILVLELVFQVVVKWSTGSFYQKIEKIRFKDIFLEPHPFLPFVHKRNFYSSKVQKPRYLLHPEANYSYPPVRTNNFRHIDGPNGDRPIVMPKPEGQIRILCLGASTTGNSLVKEGILYSYPLELEKYLQNRFPGQQIVVHNCGQGGWTSAEILINFLLNLRDTNPDIVIIYHAYNDLPASLTPGFTPDYSHALRSLGEVYYKYRLASLIPMIPLGIYNFTIQTLFPFINPRDGVLGAVSRQEADLSGDFKGLKTYERNLESIVKLCQLDGIGVVLSTFAHFMHNEIKGKVHEKYREGLRLENDVIRKMAARNNLPLVDNAKQIHEEAKYFVDSVHFTPEGMRLVAKNIGQEVAKVIERRLVSGINKSHGINSVA